MIVATPLPRLLVASSPWAIPLTASPKPVAGTFRLRADGGGVTFIFTTASLTTNRLEAMCGSRHYILRRPRPWNPARTITTRDGTNYGTITRTFNPRSGATIKAELTSADIPNAHLAFLAYGCKLVDADTTNMKI